MPAKFLTLTPCHLKAHTEWANGESGLTFVLVESGEGKSVSPSLSRKVGSGDVLVINGAGERLCAEVGELKFHWFSVHFEQMLPLFGAEEISLLHSVTEGFKGCRLYPAASPLAQDCHKLLREISKKGCSQFDLDHRLQLLRVAAAALAVEFKQALSQRSVVGATRVEDHMIEVFDRLSQDEILKLSVDELAGKFHCSRRHLNRLFHQHFGFSVGGLKMEMRLMKAVSLLRDRDSKIINVAESSGFNHLGLFNTCFKRRFGVSPGEWRKRNGGCLVPPSGYGALRGRLLLDRAGSKFGSEALESPAAGMNARTTRRDPKGKMGLGLGLGEDGPHPIIPASMAKGKGREYESAANCS